MSSASLAKPSHTFRIYLDGLDRLPEHLKISDYSLIEADARAALDAMKKPVPKNIQGRSDKGQDIGILHPGVVYITTHKHLFNFAYLCQTDDVPTEILPQVIWALEWNVLALVEAPVEQLRSIGHILPHQHGEVARFARYFMTLNSRRKLSAHILKPEVDRPIEALRHMRAAIQADGEQATRIGKPTDTWQGNPGLHIDYVVALARSRTDDAEAKVALSRIINEPLKNSQFASSHGAYSNVAARFYLARVLRRLGDIEEAQKLESWLVTWFKKNPMKIVGKTLRMWFSTDCDPSTDPVYTRLGGDEWLKGRTTTFKTAQRQTRTCRQCSASEPSITVFQCSRCKYIFYCSPECQRAHWPYHKEMCKERAESLKKVAEQRKVDPKAAKRGEDWIKWRDSNHPANNVCPMHALGLKRDPSRGATHIFVKMVEHVPSAEDVLNRFVVVQAGVFKISDVQPDIEGILGLNKNELPEFMAEISAEFDAGPGKHNDRVGFFDLMFSLQPGVQAYIGYMGIAKTRLAHVPYDPDWRAMMNKKGDPPEPIMFVSGKKDAEHDF
ncbi:hypothetical protein CPB85DRAFT_1434298 [Mucidula mucida]|nr:hypothetical protein CPB85DRAFT_1434298 [Mucidula mucida]